MLFGKPNWGWGGGANCDLYRGLFNLSAALGSAPDYLNATRESPKLCPKWRLLSYFTWKWVQGCGPS